ncbi:VOC family protein [Pelagovum pacificum]|uniref:VOC family protein n=1 Tax=Pelagovum pacificum TaxID=2588711 RepID=A0A5C5GIW7_9RHOB|nr:VOC family protein [Pelagovum pacificum]QQA43499.1 VOC family protein [Pelagovum pacificum]TNY33366.1 VOC family protein [Pelagovum pacificum]
MQPIPYIFFKDQCRAAFTAYGEIFGATPEIMDFSAMPEEDRAQMPGAAPDTVMHAALPVGSGWIYGSDDPTGETPAMAGCNVHVDFPDEAATRKAWDALAEGGEIRMPLMPTFWTPLFGALTDRFGVRWMISLTGDQPG